MVLVLSLLWTFSVHVNVLVYSQYSGTPTVQELVLPILWYSHLTCTGTPAVGTCTGTPSTLLLLLYMYWYSQYPGTPPCHIKTLLCYSDRHNKYSNLVLHTVHFYDSFSTLFCSALTISLVTFWSSFHNRKIVLLFAPKMLRSLDIL